MPKPNDRKAQKTKARQEAIRKQKAATTAQPRLLRQNPGLAEALSSRHRLLGYYVNQDWAEARMASIHVIRDAESGEVFAGFLVDLLWRGTKDAFGNYGESDVLGELLRRGRQRNPDQRLVPLDKTIAVNLIRGGVAWARRWRYPLPADIDIWLRLVDPPPTAGLDLTIFGEAGERPIVFGTPEEVARYEHPDSADLPLTDPPDAPAAGAARPGVHGPRPGGLWLPGDPLWGPEEPAPEAEAPRGPGGLWLPGGRYTEEG